MYTSPEEDRSDLYLAAAVYVIGPQVLGIILRRIPFPAGSSPLVHLLVVIATTIAVPLWLIRYRKQRLTDFDARPSGEAFFAGAIVALPMVGAYLISNFIAYGSPLTGIPLADAVTTGTYVSTVIQIITGLCVVLLAIYTTVKARTSFRADPAYLRSMVIHLGRFVAIAGGIAAGLLLLTALVRTESITAAVPILFAPLGVAGSVWLAHRRTRGSLLTTRATLLTPMVVLAFASFVILGGAFELVFGLWQAALLAGVGLVLGTLLEGHRSAWAPLGFGVVMTLVTPLLLT